MKSLADQVLTNDLDRKGLNLVEASAGTGKTYSIQTLFLRLVVARGIPVQQLLVVTFTEAATMELRERLRGILEKCRRQMEPGQKLPDGDPDRKRIEDVLKLTVHKRAETGAATVAMDDETLRKARLRRALLDFDQASIFTIHSFCQRALQEFAFECSHDFDAEVISGNALLRELCTDWWRRVRYAQPIGFAQQVARRNFPDADRLSPLVSAFVKRLGATLLPKHDDAARLAAEPQLTDSLEKAVEYAKKHVTAIKTDLESAAAAPFFPDEQKRKAIAQSLDVLCIDSTEPMVRLSLLEQLAKDLKPKKITNPAQIPPSVFECINACATCVKMADDNEMKPKKKTDDWQAPVGIQDEWTRALNAAFSLVDKHLSALEAFLLVVEQNPSAFNATDLSDSDTRKKRLQALAERKPASNVLTALKRVAALKKNSTISWVSCAETEQLRKLSGDVRDVAVLLGHIEIAAGMRDVATRYDLRKREAHTMTFDDMLERLQHALTKTETAFALQSALRDKYMAALIDEFQDTDPVQYSIFETLFSDGVIPLFFVGDPKQAIYSFRGGDIYTYCAAKEVVVTDRRYSLNTNYRSQEPLIRAVNIVFKDRDDKSLFGRSDIPYAGDLACKDLETRFVDEGVVDKRPFKIWDRRKPREEAGGNPFSHTSSEARFIYGAVAEEVVRLLACEKTGFAPRQAPADCAIKRLRASDIAILVRRHAEAAFIYRELRRRGVPVVRQAGDNVFDSPEAAELLYLLQAMVDPGRIPVIKTALVSALLPVADNELASLAREETAPCIAAQAIGISDFPDKIDTWVVLFRDASDLWHRFGFSVAFVMLMEHTGMKAWLASQPGGERSLVNIIQLQDLLHRAAVDQHLGPDALLGWYQRQLESDTREENDAFETRLESDADAVQIMTIFKSKGLEFPVVFVPTLWTTIAGKTKEVCRVYHEPVAASEATPNGGKPAKAQLPAVFLHVNTNDKEAKKKGERERNQEDMRNFYVAATRASHRTYVVAGDLGTKKSTLTVCMPRELLTRWAADENGVIDVVQKQFTPAPLTRWAIPADKKKGDLAAKGVATVDRSRGHASYSSIAPHGAGPGTGEAYDFDADDTVGGEDPAPDGQNLTPFSFPAGARTGECWHRIFEVLDFSADDASIRAIVNEQLALFRLDKGTEKEKQAKQDVTFEMVRAVLQAELAVDSGHFRLADVKPGCKRPEMAFDFSLQASGKTDADGKLRNAIWTALREEWKNATDEEALFLARLQGWEQTIPGGFMTGFVDLFFEHHGLYYILDWKSNRLDGMPENFSRKGMAAEMAKHAYFLQYLIYTMTAHRYLAQCLGKEYDYDKHFGGVLYLFVRGIGSDSIPNSQRGIYYAKPSKALVESLAAALMTHKEGEAGS